MGKPEENNKKWGSLCDWFGEHTWLSLVGPELEVRAKNREVGSH